ncbi:MAG TPA: formylglycine-generating enzyme family protein [Polyangia bacterium]|jgi:formylglycine-generating enzyme required for sulfatase activity|nr:formylglycine-generating enzyme family protein [Polyangia bacterium]
MPTRTLSPQTTVERANRLGMEWIPGGEFMMGSNRHYREEAPAHLETVDGFWLDRWPVTNEQFRRFIEETGYVTQAEIAPDAAQYPGADPALLVPASVVFVKPAGRVDMRNFLNWWAFVPGANWRHPTGPESAIAGLEQHPVVHVGFEDATAFVQWAGKALPTEAEWELAARGGLDQTEFAWGDELEPEGRAMANTWQGEFPYENLLGDGFETTSPVGTFPPNGWGLYDMIGNVWEWTTDWYTSGHRKPEEDASCCGGADKRTARERSYDPTVALPIPRKVIKGGSFLCAPNYCRRYRPAARMAQAIDTSTCHLGFRCIVREP